MTRAELEQWLSRYGQAWEARDPDAAALLFTEDARYQETPFSEPARGQDGVRAYWAAATANQRAVLFSSRVLALTGPEAVVRWQAEFERVSTGVRIKLDGVFLLEFDEGQGCRNLLEWWHRLEGDQPEPRC
jgi:nuclear transport factor 2 (NTF2) superfamily protein